MKKLFLYFGIVFLSGCVTLMKPKEELKQIASYKVERLILEGQYQKLLKCWDDKAEKMWIASVNQTSINLYQDLKYAEIQGGGAAGAYAVLIELKQTSRKNVELNAYGTGYLGEKYAPLWVNLLKSCSKL